MGKRRKNDVSLYRGWVLWFFQKMIFLWISFLLKCLEGGKRKSQQQESSYVPSAHLAFLAARPLPGTTVRREATPYTHAMCGRATAPSSPQAASSNARFACSRRGPDQRRAPRPPAHAQDPTSSKRTKTNHFTASAKPSRRYLHLENLYSHHQNRSRQPFEFSKRTKTRHVRKGRNILDFCATAR